MHPTVYYSINSTSSGDWASYWKNACGRTYFALEPKYREPEQFAGTLLTWDLGKVRASRYTADAARYERNPRHLRSSIDEDFLLTFPRRGAFRFKQLGRKAHCPPGSFFVERSDEPFVLSHDTTAELLVAKINSRDIRTYLPRPERFCAIAFDCDHSAGGLLVDLLNISEARGPELTAENKALLGRQFIELLAVAVESDPSAISSGESSVRFAHLQRINATISQRYSETKLTPADVASACGISLRYLHDLCSNDGASFGERLRQTRLDMVQRALLNRSGRRSITDIALSAGFSDMSSFSRTYRRAFSESPRETRARALYEE